MSVINNVVQWTCERVQCLSGDDTDRLSNWRFQLKDLKKCSRIQLKQLKQHKREVKRAFKQCEISEGKYKRCKQEYRDQCDSIKKAVQIACLRLKLAEQDMRWRSSIFYGRFSVLDKK